MRTACLSLASFDLWLMPEPNCRPVTHSVATCHYSLLKHQVWKEETAAHHVIEPSLPTIGLALHWSCAWLPLRHCMWHGVRHHRLRACMG